MCFAKFLVAPVGQKDRMKLLLFGQLLLACSRAFGEGLPALPPGELEQLDSMNCAAVTIARGMLLLPVERRTLLDELRAKDAAARRPKRHQMYPPLEVKVD